MKWCITILAAATVLAACGDSTGNNGGGGSSNFTGIVTRDDGLASGSLAFTIPVTALLRSAPTEVALLGSSSVTGTLSYDGAAAVALTGTYDDVTDVLSLTGGGFTFDGGFDGVDRIEGLMSGAASGTFVTAKGNSATAYCGTFVADNNANDTGTFSFVIAGSTIRGNAVSSLDNTLTPLDGTLTGTTITIFVPGTTTEPFLATGTRSGTSASGTFDDQEGTTGTWAGTVCP